MTFLFDLKSVNYPLHNHRDQWSHIHILIRFINTLFLKLNMDLVITLSYLSNLLLLSEKQYKYILSPSTPPKIFSVYIFNFLLSLIPHPFLDSKVSSTPCLDSHPFSNSKNVLTPLSYYHLLKYIFHHTYAISSVWYTISECNHTNSSNSN